MFWKKARNKYAQITRDDLDVQKYFSIMENLQKAGYNGLSGYIQDLGHKYVSRFTKNGLTLEIGFGRGRQGLFFKGKIDNYYPVELNRNYKNDIWNKFKNLHIGNACNLAFKDNSFDQVVSVYNLEHIPRIEQVLQEVKRVLKKDGTFVVALPCEDGFLNNIIREFTTMPLMKKHYHINYDKIIAFEHVHSIHSLKVFLKKYFYIQSHFYYPFYLPSPHLNLVYCCTCIHNN